MSVVSLVPVPGTSSSTTEGSSVSGGVVTGGGTATVVGGVAVIGPGSAADCPDITTPSVGEIVASLTDAGRILLARQPMEGLSFRVIGFRVGSGGYIPETPTQTVAIDTAATELTGTYTFPELPAAPETIDRTQYANDYAPAYLCRLDASEAVFPVGEWGLYAEILESPENPEEVGSEVLYAVAHRPMLTKTNQDVFVCRIVNQH